MSEDLRDGHWHTGPDLAAYVRLNQEWAIRLAKVEKERDVLLAALKEIESMTDLDPFWLVARVAIDRAKKGGSDEQLAP